MKITFHTNLDMAKGYVYDQTSPVFNKAEWTHIPAVGSLIRFNLPIEPKGSYFELEVVSVYYSANGQQCTVELHIPRIPSRSIAEWEQWMKRRLGAA